MAHPPSGIPSSVNQTGESGANDETSPYALSTNSQSSISDADETRRHEVSLASSADSEDARAHLRGPSSIRDMLQAPIPSVRFLPGGALRNRHRGPNPYNDPSYRFASAAVTGEPGKEAPMHYSFPVRTPVAGKYVPPPSWYAGIGTWAWWKPGCVYWAKCEGCYEDQGCLAPDGFFDTCDWRCCLSCWCPWCKSPLVSSEGLVTVG
jgi:hypothetical protein